MSLSSTGFAVEDSMLPVRLVLLPLGSVGEPPPLIIVLMRLYIKNVDGLSVIAADVLFVELLLLVSEFDPLLPLLLLQLLFLGVWGSGVFPLDLVSGSFWFSSIKYTVRREPAAPRVKLLPVTSGASSRLVKKMIIILNFVRKLFRTDFYHKKYRQFLVSWIVS